MYAEVMDALVVSSIKCSTFMLFGLIQRSNEAKVSESSIQDFCDRRACDNEQAATCFDTLEKIRCKEV